MSGKGECVCVKLYYHQTNLSSNHITITSQPLIMIIITNKSSDEGGNVEVVGVMKDKKTKFHETEASHTLGEVGEGRVL